MALNIADLAEHAIDAVPDRVALICGDEQITYAGLEEKANRLAHYLISRGVKKDDKVGLYCRNRIEIVFGRLKDGRRVATRYDRCPKDFLSAIALAATVVFWL